MRAPRDRRTVGGAVETGFPTIGERTTMSSETRTTTDHDEIRRWVEEHDGGDSTFFKLVSR